MPVLEIASIPALDRLLGLDVGPADLSLGQMTARALVVFLWGVILVRLGDRRLLGKNAGFDMLLVVILGSVLSRAINGQAAFFPTLGVSGMLVLFHHVISTVTYHSPLVSRWAKGSPATLIRGGKLQPEALERSKISRDDLEENLRLNGNLRSPSDVDEARLERNGSISVIEKS